jgi:aryl-alcohol dehydrogenase-like predicted oxidoreductase
MVVWQTRAMFESRAAIGGGNFGGAGSPSALIGEGLDEAGAHAALDVADRLGVTLIDTAHSYAAGRSQEMIGTWLAARPGRVERMRVVDKVGVVERHGELMLDLSFDSVLAHAATGRRRLGVEAVDVVMTHATDPDTPREETLEALGLLIDQGHARAWGLSNVDGKTLEQWLDIAQTIGLARPEAVENQYNFLERSVEEDVLPMCRGEGISFLAYSPLASGLLVGKYRRGEPPPDGSMMALRPDMAAEFDDRAADAIASVSRVASELDASMAAVAFAWLIQQPDVIPIAGPSKPHHMDAIEEALGLDLTDTEFG